MGTNETFLSRLFSKRMREIVFRMTFHFFKERDKVSLVKEYPLDADVNDGAEVYYNYVDGSPSEDGPADTGSSAFDSAALSSPHTS